MIVHDEEVIATIAEHSGRCILCGLNGSTPLVNYHFKSVWLKDQTVTLCSECAKRFEQLQEILSRETKARSAIRAIA